MTTPDATPGTRPSLYIVDAMNFLFRAFHALPPLTTSRGVQTGAIYGLCQMILRIEREQRPTHLCVVYDAPGDNFRNEIFPAYKAHRPPMPPELAAQLAMVRRVIEAFGLTQLQVSGFEADDIIATLAKIAAAAGMEVVICSSDKDLLQLCDGDVAVLDTMRNRRLGPAEVREKFGVPPERVGDVLALMGDSVDNVPGVTGIGPKTAAELINTFARAMAEILMQAREQSIVPHAVQGWTSRKTYPPSSSYSTGRRSKSVSQAGQEAESNCFLTSVVCHKRLRHTIEIAVMAHGILETLKVRY